MLSSPQSGPDAQHIINRNQPTWEGRVIHQVPRGPDTVRDAQGIQRLSKQQPLFAQSSESQSFTARATRPCASTQPPGPQSPQPADTIAFDSHQACCKALEGNLHENALPNTHVNQKQHCNLAIIIKSTGFALFSGLFSHFPQYRVHQLLLIERTIPTATTIFSTPVWLTQMAIRKMYSFHSV